MSSYDDWKLMCPDDERRTYDCDCCGKETPRRYIQQCWTTCGIETFACPECRGEDEPEPEYCPHCAMPPLGKLPQYPDCNCPDDD